MGFPVPPPQFTFEGRMVKERRLQVGATRWGSGKVHRVLYDRENRVWYPACLDPGENYYGQDVDDKTPVTCKKVGCYEAD